MPTESIKSDLFVRFFLLFFFCVLFRLPYFFMIVVAIARFIVGQENIKRKMKNVFFCQRLKSKSKIK